MDDETLDFESDPEDEDGGESPGGKRAPKRKAGKGAHKDSAAAPVEAEGRRGKTRRADASVGRPAKGGQSKGEGPTPFTFGRIIDQERALRIVQAALASDRVAGAYLFHGDPGVGKLLAALALAAALNCEAPIETPLGVEACGNCGFCRKIARLSHPDVHLALPVPATFRRGQPASVDPEKYREVLDAIAAKRYYSLAFSRNVTLSVDQIRGLIHEASMTRVEGRRKVMIIARADRMNDSAANALLKTLEEPPADLVVILTAPEPGRLLPTVASRCQHVRFDPLAPEAIARVLAGDLACETRKARLLSVLARGSLGRALEMLEEDPVAFRNGVLELLKPHATCSELLARVRAIVGWDQTAARQVAEVLLMWLRDALAVRYGLGEEDVLNRDRLDDLAETARRLDPVEIRRRLDVLEDLVRTINANVTPDLAVYSALVRLEEGRERSAGARS